MATSKFTPPAVPSFEVTPQLRAYLDEQMRRLGVLVNNSAQLEDELLPDELLSDNVPLLDGDETITGEWTFSATPTFTVDPILAFADPALVFIETDAAADNTTWDFRVQSEQLFGRVIDDAQTAAANWLVVNRTANVIDSIALAGTDITLDGAVAIPDTLAVGSAASKATITDDGTTFSLRAASVTGVLDIGAAAIQSLCMTVLSLADDATGTFTLPASRNGGLLFLTATNTANVMTSEFAILYVDDAASITEIAVPAGIISTGGGSNPDVDGDINVWSDVAGVISVKNRRGASRRIQLVLMG